MPGQRRRQEKSGEATATLDEGAVEPQSSSWLVKERKYLNRRILLWDSGGITWDRDLAFVKLPWRSERRIRILHSRGDYGVLQ